MPYSTPNKPKAPAHDGSREAAKVFVERLNMLLHVLYFVFYALGVKTILYARVAGRAIRSFVTGTLREQLVRAGKAVLRGLKRAVLWLYREVSLPVVTVVRAAKNASRHVREAFRQSRRDGLTCLLASVLYILAQLGKALLHLLNYIAPAAAIYLLSLMIGYYANVDYALAIKYDGYTIGYVSDLALYDEAKSMLYDRLASIHLTPEDVRIGQASYTVVFVPEDELSAVSELCDEMIQKSISDLTVAYGVYIDGEYYGAVEDGERLNSYLQMRLDTAVAAVGMRPTVEEKDDNGALTDGGMSSDKLSARFVKDIEVTEGYYPRDGLVELDPLLDTFGSIVSGEQTYVAQAGDSAWKICQNLDNISLDELYALNPWMEEGTIYPGDEIVVSSEVPYLEVQLLAQITYTEEIAQAIERVESSSHYVGYAEVTDTGEPGEERVVANVVYQNGVEVDREIVSETVITEPVSGKMLVGTKATGYATYSAVQSGSATATSATGSFMWPVDGGYVSCGFYGYWNHGGMDIAAARGTNIRAADGGLVQVSTLNYAIGYGNYIIINHGNGISTLYAHCSARYVSAGQYVSKGDVIAAVGMTGNATGNHLHFEIRLNGVRVDPSKYIGTSYWR